MDFQMTMTKSNRLQPTPVGALRFVENLVGVRTSFYLGWLSRNVSQLSPVMDENPPRTWEETCAEVMKRANSLDRVIARRLLRKPAKKHISTCYIGQHVKQRDYVLLQFRESERFASTMVGPVIHISNKEMAERGLAIVLHHLRDGPAPVCQPICFADAETKKEMLKLKREHVLVDFELLESDQFELKVIPLHRGHGWRFEAIADEVRTFPLPKTNGEFLKLLGEALETAV